MRFAIYADLPRTLSGDEQGAVFEALDSLVPEGGCVGPQRGVECEIYFEVDEPSREMAETKAREYLRDILQRARLDTSYLVTLQPF